MTGPFPWQAAADAPTIGAESANTTNRSAQVNQLLAAHGGGAGYVNSNEINWYTEPGFPNTEPITSVGVYPSGVGNASVDFYDGSNATLPAPWAGAFSTADMTNSPGSYWPDQSIFVSALNGLPTNSYASRQIVQNGVCYIACYPTYGSATNTVYQVTADANGNPVATLVSGSWDASAVNPIVGYAIVVVGNTAYGLGFTGGVSNGPAGLYTAPVTNGIVGAFTLVYTWSSIPMVSSSKLVLTGNALIAYFPPGQGSDDETNRIFVFPVSGTTVTLTPTGFWNPPTQYYYVGSSQLAANQFGAAWLSGPNILVLGYSWTRLDANSHPTVWNVFGLFILNMFSASDTAGEGFDSLISGAIGPSSVFLANQAMSMGNTYGEYKYYQLDALYTFSPYSPAPYPVVHQLNGNGSGGGSKLPPTPSASGMPIKVGNAWVVDGAVIRFTPAQRVALEATVDLRQQATVFNASSVVTLSSQTPQLSAGDRLASFTSGSRLLDAQFTSDGVLIGWRETVQSENGTPTVTAMKVLYSGDLVVGVETIS